MNKKVALIVLFLFVVMILFMIFNGQSSKTAKKDISLTIAYQGGIGYAPVHVMEDQNIVEKNYNGKISVNFVKLDSGAAINEGIIGGTIDVGCMGLAPAITGVSRGIPYKVISNLCSQSHGLMSNDKNIKSLADIKPEDKIALVGTGSIQHILLSMASEKVLGNPNALDINIQNMSHAEGMASLESGTVKLHLTSSPFIYQERENAKYIELKELSEVWPSGNTFLLAMASNKLAENKALFTAVEKSFAEAIQFINENQEATAELETKYLGLNIDTVKNYLSQPDSQFFPELRGAQAMSEFMVRAGFIEKGITMEQFCFPGVNGK
jgi:NitT/TauT family transport system substrate-binding protein